MSGITIIREQFAISGGEIGDEFDIGRDPDSHAPILVNSTEDACAIARLAANRAKRPMRVLKVVEVAFVQPDRALDPENVS